MSISPAIRTGSTCKGRPHGQHRQLNKLPCTPASTPPRPPPRRWPAATCPACRPSSRAARRAWGWKRCACWPAPAPVYWCRRATRIRRKRPGWHGRRGGRRARPARSAIDRRLCRRLSCHRPRPARAGQRRRHHGHAPAARCARLRGAVRDESPGAFPADGAFVARLAAGAGRARGVRVVAGTPAGRRGPGRPAFPASAVRQVARVCAVEKRQCAVCRGAGPARCGARRARLLAASGRHPDAAGAPPGPR